MEASSNCIWWTWYWFLRFHLSEVQLDSLVDPKLIKDGMILSTYNHTRWPLTFYVTCLHVHNRRREWLRYECSWLTTLLFDLGTYFEIHVEMMPNVESRIGAWKDSEFYRDLLLLFYVKFLVGVYPRKVVGRIMIGSWCFIHRHQSNKIAPGRRLKKPYTDSKWTRSGFHLHKRKTFIQRLSVRTIMYEKQIIPRNQE